MSADIIFFPRPASDAQDRLDVARDHVFDVLEANSLEAAKLLAWKALAAMDGEDSP